MPISKYDGTTDPMLHICCVCGENCQDEARSGVLKPQEDGTTHIYSGHTKCLTSVTDISEYTYRVAYRSEDGNLTW